nr:hypothetical protein [Pleurocapsa sp. PCC 7327]
MIAKSASAATAALGCAGYLLNVFGVSDRTFLISTALDAVVLLISIVLGGIHRSNPVNITIVSVTQTSTLLEIEQSFSSIATKSDWRKKIRSPFLAYPKS